MTVLPDAETRRISGLKRAPARRPFILVKSASALPHRFGGAAEGRETAFFTLRRGGARFLTGAIGKARGSRFRTTTAPASIEVETGEFVAIVAKGLQLSVGVGRVDLRNERGVLGVVAGQRAFVADRATAPYLVGTAIPYRIAP